MNLKRGLFFLFFLISLNLVLADIYSEKPIHDTYVESGANSEVNYNGTNYTVGIYQLYTVYRTYLLFNVSEINSMDTVQDAFLYIYWTSAGWNGFEGATNISIGIYHVFNPFDESVLVWGNQSCGSNFNNISACNTTKIDSVPYLISPSYVSLAPNWTAWNLTNLLKRVKGNDTVTLAVRIVEDNDSQICGDIEGNSQCRLRGIDIQHPTLFPYMNVTYTPFSSNLNVSLNQPINTFLTNNSIVTINCSATSLISPSNLTLILDDLANYTIFNSSSENLISLQVNYNLTNGTHNWSCHAEDTLTTFDSLTRTFTISIPEPVIPPIIVEDTVKDTITYVGAGLGVFIDRLTIPLAIFLILFAFILLFIIVANSIGVSIKQKIQQ